MNTFIAMFSNRELAMGVWIGIISLIFLLNKSLHPAFKQCLKVVIPILFSKKFVLLYIIFILHLLGVLHLLQTVHIWNDNYAKDTIFWILFVEFPLCAKSIQTKDGNIFFAKLIKDNLKIIGIFEFFINYWSFSFWIEFLIVPIATILAILSFIASRDKKYLQTTKVINIFYASFGILVFVNAIYNTIQKPLEFFNLQTLNSFVLPIFLLLLNLPVVYGLALYSGYEQLFIRIKYGASHKAKMKILLLHFCGLNLSRVKSVRENLHTTLLISLTPNALKTNLQLLDQKLSLQIGDVYMKRSNFYLTMYGLSFFASLIGLILINSEVSIKDLLTFNFIIIKPRMRDILTYIFASSLVLSIGAIIFAVGFCKKKYEEISQIKKYAIYDFLITLKMQHQHIEEYPSYDNPTTLYAEYVIYATQLQYECKKLLNAYGNLLPSYERDRIESLYTSTVGFLTDFSDKEGTFSECPASEFIKRYNIKVTTAPQNEKINVFHSTLRNDLEKYISKIKELFDDYADYY